MMASRSKTDCHKTGDNSKRSAIGYEDFANQYFQSRHRYSEDTPCQDSISVTAVEDTYHLEEESYDKSECCVECLCSDCNKELIGFAMVSQSGMLRSSSVGSFNGSGCEENRNYDDAKITRDDEESNNNLKQMGESVSSFVRASVVDETEEEQNFRNQFNNTLNQRHIMSNYYPTTLQPLQFQRHFMDILNRATRTRTLHTSIRAVIPTMVHIRPRVPSSDRHRYQRRRHGGDNFSDCEEDSNEQSIDYDDETASSITGDSAFLEFEESQQFMNYLANSSVIQSTKNIDMPSSSHTLYESNTNQVTQSSNITGHLSAVSRRFGSSSIPKENGATLDLSLPSYSNSEVINDNGILDVSSCSQAISTSTDSFQLKSSARNESQNVRVINHLNVSSSTTTNGECSQVKFCQKSTIELESSPDTTGSEVSTMSYTYHASPDSKYETYAIHVDRTQGDGACEIAIFSFDRPHMRGFHMAWLGFFIAFFIWYAITPLLSEVQESLNLSKAEIWTSSICAVTGTTICRLLMGPLTDVYGARICMGTIVLLASVPTACIGTVQNLLWLCIVRALVSIAGSAFVMCQAWTTVMFTKEVAGTANALAAGWGNLGGGLTQITMGSILFPLFKTIYLSKNPDKTSSEAVDFSWRTVSIIPAFFAFLYGIYVIRNADDCPKGNYAKLKRLGFRTNAISVRHSMKAAAYDPNTWLLSIQYACCFGVELTVNNAAALYFQDEFGQSTESAAAIASAFGLMNLFARGFGGFVSDVANAMLGMNGRLIWQSLSLLIEGLLIILFANMNSLSLAIIMMTLFSIFVQASEGSTFGIVPYVHPPVTGSIAGIVGAMGSAGAVGFGMIFRAYDYKISFTYMGIIVAFSSILSIFIQIKGTCCSNNKQTNEEDKVSGVNELAAAVPTSPALESETVMAHAGNQISRE